MDGTLVAAIVALAVASIGSFNTLFGKKIKAPADTATERRDTIADRDSLIATLASRVEGLEGRVSRAESEIKEVRTLNEKLKASLYRVLSILREKDLLGLLKPGDIPEDIHY